MKWLKRMGLGLLCLGADAVAADPPAPLPPPEFKQPIDGVGYLKIGNNHVYVVGPKRDALIIDAYYAQNARDTIAGLETAGLRASHVRAIVITHAHDDHYGGAGALSAWRRAPIWAHPYTAAQMDDPWATFSTPGAALPNTSMADWEAFRAKAGESTRVARVLREGDVLEHQGFKLEVVYAPGHERGEIALFDRARGLLFSGDLVQGPFDPATHQCDLGTGWRFTDISAQRRSLQRVAALGARWNFKGHGLMSGADVQADFACALARLDSLEKVVLEALGEKSPRRLPELVGAWIRKMAAKNRKVEDYSIVSVHAMALDLSRRGLVRRNDNLEWELVRGAR